MLPGEAIAGSALGLSPLPRTSDMRGKSILATRRAQAATGGSPGAVAAGGAQPSYPHNMSKAERQAETQRRIAEAKARMAAAQHRLGRAAVDAGRAAASAAAAATSSAAALDKATAVLGSANASTASSATAAALALARQEAEKSDQAVAAVAAAVAGEAERQQALLERMRSQLAWLQESMPQQQPGSHPLLQSIDDNAFAAALHKPPSAAAGAPARATTGIAMAVASAPGAGRQLLAATGRVVAAAAVATAVREQVQLAQAAAAGAPAGTAGCVRQRTFDPLPRHEPQALQEQQREKPRWTAVNLLLAPLTPLLHGLAAPRNRNSRNAAGEAAPSRNGYDLLLELLSSLAAGVQGDARYDTLRDLLAAAPTSGQPRYDFARSLLRGLVAAEPGYTGSPLGLARGLLQRVQAGGGPGPDSGSTYDPAWVLLKEASLLEEWGPPLGSKYDPLEGFSGWAAAPAAAPRSRYCPWGDLVAAVMAWRQPRGRAGSKYDPWASVSAAARDPAWHGPTGASRYCPLSAALDAAAGWQAPSGFQRYDPLGEARQAAASWGPTREADPADDPLAWLFDCLLDGWAGDRRRPQLAAGLGRAGLDDDGGAAYSFA